MFTVNMNLIDSAHRKLVDYPNIYWIIGGACTGKSTISKAIAAAYDIPLYDMDTHIYGGYPYDADRHPVNKAWLSASNPLDWQLSLAAEDFDAFNRAANAEYLDLFADDMKGNHSRQPILVDGGITHPSVLCQVIPRENIFCIDADRAECIQIWETSEARAEMKQWILNLPDPKSKWETLSNLMNSLAEPSSKNVTHTTSKFICVMSIHLLISYNSTSPIISSSRMIYQGCD